MLYCVMQNKGLLHRIRKAIFPYKFVIVKAGEKGGAGGGMKMRPSAAETAPIMQNKVRTGTCIFHHAYLMYRSLLL